MRGGVYRIEVEGPTQSPLIVRWTARPFHLHFPNNKTEPNKSYTPSDPPYESLVFDRTAVLRETYVHVRQKGKGVGPSKKKKNRAAAWLDVCAGRERAVMWLLCPSPPWGWRKPYPYCTALLNGACFHVIFIFNFIIILENEKRKKRLLLGLHSIRVRGGGEVRVEQRMEKRSCLGVREPHVEGT